jgi:hypothetical protein
MPCIEVLTALHELPLDVADYVHGSRAFTVLSRSLPCLQQLQVLRLRASGVVALQAGDVLAIGRVQQQKVAAFASGMHSRLGAASGVSWLDEQALMMIADEVLGGWGLLKEWRQELVAAKV